MHNSEDNIIPLPTAHDIEASAASWLVVLGREDVSHDDKANFKSWLESSDRHRETFTELAAMWDDMALLEDLEDIARGTVAAEQKKPSPFLHSRRTLLGGIAASIGVIAVSTSLWTLSDKESFYQTDSFATVIGQQKSVSLSDGSTMQINTNTELDINFNPHARLVKILYGEAHFEVAKDKNRPFYVSAAGGIVRAVGTAFVVRVRSNNTVEVTVEEGRVAVSPALHYPEVFLQNKTEKKTALEAPILAELTAGQSAIFDEKIERIEQMPQSEIQRKLAWRQGLLAYAGDPLSDVVADVSRYTNMTIEIADPSLGNMPIGGYFRVGETDALFDSLEVTFGLNVEHIGKNHVRLSAS